MPFVTAALTLFCLLSEQELLRAPVIDPGAFRAALSRTLAMVDAKVKPGSPSQNGSSIPALFAGFDKSTKIVLPAALCGMTEIFYQCVWETVPNKNSVAVLQDEIATLVSGSVSQNWRRDHGQNLQSRWSEFLSPEGTIAVTVRCPVTNTNLPLPSYTVTLTIHSPSLRL